MNDYTINYNNFDLSKPHGLSVYMKLKNEEDFLESVIHNIVNYVDEIICVYNDSVDKTSEILKDLQLTYPDKIKVFYYEPKVYPFTSIEYQREHSSSPHSFVNYNNWTLSKTTFKYCLKVDGDDFYIPEIFEAKVKKLLSEKPEKEYWNIIGINLYDYNGEMKIIHDPYNGYPFCGGTDRGFFPISRNTIYTYHQDYEVFEGEKYLKCIELGFMYFHIRALKRDRGLRSLQLERNFETNISKRFFNLLNPKLYTWEEFSKENQWLTNQAINPNLFKHLIKLRSKGDIEYLNSLSKLI